MGLSGKRPMVAGYGLTDAGKKRLAGVSNLDFGWRVRGKTIRVLHDSSFKLISTPRSAVSVELARYCGNNNAFQSCLQCGACTVNCQLAQTDGSLFPRRQITLLQLGETEKLIADPSIWLCFNCKECTSRCPAEAAPGRIMAAIRRVAVERFSVFQCWSRVINEPRGFVFMLLVGVTSLSAAIAIGGSFSPSLTVVRYSSVLPHSMLNSFFGMLTIFVVATAISGVAKAWQTFTGEGIRETDLKRAIQPFLRAISQVAKHKQFRECQQFPLSRWAHLSLFYGFLGLLALAGCAAVLITMGARYPLESLHPLKLAGNLAAGLIIFGCSYFWVQRQRASQMRDRSSWFDWAPLMELLAVSLTGVLAEVFRYGNLAAVAYPTYFLHLTFVFVLFVSAPSSKLAHAFYRTIAMTAEEYNRRAASPVSEVVPARMAA